MANAFYNRGASFNPDELADGDAIEAEFDSVGRGFDTIEDLVNANKAGYPSQTFHVAPATEPTHAIQQAQLEEALSFKLDAVNYNATDVLNKLKTVDGYDSGLDADCLDGQHGSYYRNATNINTGTLAKERLPASIDASTTGNAATATQTIATAAAGATADLVKGTMGANDFFRIRVGGNTDAGWTEIATADNGDEPIYIRQYTGDFVTIARTLTLLDARGNSVFPGNIRAATGGVTVKDTDCGMYPGNGDSASSTINNLKLSSWFGIGFGPSITGQSVPYGEYSHWFNTRNGDMGCRGTITANFFNGRAYPAKPNGEAINFYWAGQGGQPPWLWGGHDGLNMYVYDPSNFSVNYANTSGWVNTITNNVAVLTGEVYHGNWLPIPDGYQEWQCKFFISPRSTNPYDNAWDLREGLNTQHYSQYCYLQNTRQVIMQTRVYNDINDNFQYHNGSVNYIVVGVK